MRSTRLRRSFCEPGTIRPSRRGVRFKDSGFTDSARTVGFDVWKTEGVFGTKPRSSFTALRRFATSDSLDSSLTVFQGRFDAAPGDRAASADAIRDALIRGGSSLSCGGCSTCVAGG